MVESTGLVMTPYIEYPQLLGVLLRMLNEGEGSPLVRREVLKVCLDSPLLPRTCAHATCLSASWQLQTISDKASML